MLRAASGPLSAHSGLTSSLVSVWTFDSKLPKWVRRLLICSSTLYMCRVGRAHTLALGG